MMDCEPFVTQQDPSSDSVERISWMPRAVWIRHREDMQGSRHCSGSQSVTAQPWPIWALEIRVAGTSPHFWAAFPCAGLTHSLWTHTDTQIFISRAYRLKQTHARLLLHTLRCAQPRLVYLCYVPSSQKHPPQLLLEGTAMITPASQPGWQPSALPRRWR